MENSENNNNSKFMKWFKRVGWAGFAFFTIKGLMWLVIFYFGADTLQSCIK
ncbi:histidine kinase [Chryseobacterium indologenes]|uniref:Histidine kinase n=1 Tax=Chryseobacterium indologenes TaxID=253 RepID=A0A0N0ZVG2_CHRID|nr:histidine kinase [Chryseobacterium indologenes]